ncbi:hypothetical protein [Pseudogemmobacter faecipullorum]|uniref:Uncharacterized protein n=1 Tax=Pseudogemmobacter faecipullorum TaxID=2755041 RepID=A0ABS8CSR0_9RHOB|nr:hypothetical protein [Pseudogemmobacter faecipullorum]MCB5411815.1 hypothetical protein [Pseudogemmobacter faecipullorum]
MIRRPSTSAQLYAWHRSALINPDLPRQDGLPECGWYKTRLIRGGPWVPVEISIQREIDPETGELTGPERMACEVDGVRREPASIWSHLTPITRAEFLALTERREAIPAMAATMARLDLTERAIRP